MVKVSNSAIAVDEPSDKKKVENFLNAKKKKILKFQYQAQQVLLVLKFVKN